jgi:hypothetical protein
MRAADDFTTIKAHLTELERRRQAARDREDHRRRLEADRRRRDEIIRAEDRAKELVRRAFG